jgi:fucose 4-O-acetylase-like acetyltransferase
MVRTLVWWTVAAASAILSIFFLFVGISLCRAAYDLEHPYQFILTFFSSNLIILISVVILLGAVLRMIGRLRQGQAPAAADSLRLTPDSSRKRDLRSRNPHDQPNS